MARVFVGIGSNEGDRLRHVSDAVRALASSGDIAIVQMATLIETEPVGGPPQGPYLNTAIELRTSLAPEDLLNVLQQTERNLGRRPSGERWGPRPIDLDLLLYDARILQTPGLVVPHPRMHERRFVLEPLMQLAPDVVHPALRRSISELFHALAPVAV